MNFLKGFWQRLTRWFSRGKPLPPWPAFSVDTIVQEFRLLEQARSLASLGLPAFHAKAPTSIELEVVRYREAARDQVQRQVASEQERVDQSIRQLHAHVYDVESGLLGSDFERRAQLIFNEQKSWLDKLARQARSRLSELQKFRRTHQLEREAHYPEGAGLFFRYAVLLLLVVGEGVFNANFFAEGLSSGLLGGFFYAATLAALNVGVCFVLGYAGVRHIHHVQLANRLLGVFSLLFALAFTLLMALSIGHLRDAILHESATPTRDAFYALLANPLGLDDLVAWVLGLVTVGFGLGALIDGHGIDDAYPGYGPLARRCHAAVDEFEDEFEEVRASLEDLRQENIVSLDQEVLRVHGQLKQFRLWLDEKKAIHQRGLQSLQDSETALYACLRLFRAENERHRKDALRPAYFDTLPTLRGVTLDKPNEDTLEKAYQDMVERLREMETTLPERRAQVYALFDRHLEELNPLLPAIHAQQEEGW